MEIGKYIYLSRDTGLVERVLVTDITRDGDEITEFSYVRESGRTVYTKTIGRLTNSEDTGLLRTGTLLDVSIYQKIIRVRVKSWTRGIPMRLQVTDEYGNTYEILEEDIIRNFGSESGDTDGDTIHPPTIAHNQGFMLTGKVWKNEVGPEGGQVSYMEVENRGRISLSEMLTELEGNRVKLTVEVLEEDGTNPPG